MRLYRHPGQQRPSSVSRVSPSLQVLQVSSVQCEQGLGQLQELLQLPSRNIGLPDGHAGRPVSIGRTLIQTPRATSNVSSAVQTLQLAIKQCEQGLGQLHLLLQEPSLNIGLPDGHADRSSVRFTTGQAASTENTNNAKQQNVNNATSFLFNP